MNTENSNDLAVEVADLKSEVHALRRALTMMLAIVLFLTLALNAVFLWQNRVVAQQLETARADRDQFQKTAAPAMDQFLQRLQRFAANNPDFNPILAKYVATRPNPVPRGDSLSLPPK
jgi:hypothetical protein